MNSKHCLLISGLILASLSLSACDKTSPSAQTSTPPIKPSSHTGSAKTMHCQTDALHQGIPPQIYQTKFLKDSQGLCFKQFSVLHSGITKGPLWAAEYLTPKKVQTKVKRQGEFHEEERIQDPKKRAALSDYRKSGYDRGHLAPSANMSTKAAQQDSFSLANMVPQNPTVNQNAWRNVEEAVRDWVAHSKKPAYLVTGVAFLNSKIPTIGSNKVMVPSHVYKAVYQPDTGVIGVYWIDNPPPSTKRKSMRPEIISVCQLQAKTGINVFPMLDTTERRQLYALPIRGSDVPQNGRIKALKADQNSAC